jgi:hypothetical protein
LKTESEDNFELLVIRVESARLHIQFNGGNSVQAKPLILLLCCGLSLNCSQSGSSSQPLASQQSTASGSPLPAATSPPASGSLTTGLKVDSCKMLTSDELKAVLGEPLKETKASDRADGGFNVSQCFYSLPTFSKSVSLSVTSAGTRDVREFWDETFHREEAEKQSERKEEKEKAKDRKEPRTEKKEGRGEEEEESHPPQKVAGAGDEAFWIGSPIGGALYVLKKNVFFRISIGGSDDQKTRLNKSKALATKILARV